MEDKELIQACREGNWEQFKGIVDKYGAQTMALAMNILGNREDAQDASQETFIQVFRNLSLFDVERNFKPWLFTILFRRCLDRMKKRRRFAEAFSRMKNEHLVEQNPVTATELANPSPKNQSLSRNWLECLNPKERTALCLWANEDYTAVEISRVLRCSASTARVYLFNARRKIKSLTEKMNVRL
jgi:RNA polymerase sigma-70 factor (ECF subfamily)